MSEVFWSAHTHSRYSANDALPTVPKVVQRAAELDYPALGLTDHGNPAGTVELYTECRKRDIKPLPGMEAYVAIDRSHRNIGPTGKTGRIATHHMCFLATSTEGYRNLVGLNNHAVHNFFYTPVLDLGDLAEFSAKGMLQGVIATTGCWFGILAKQLRDGGDPTAALNMVKAMQHWFDGELYVEIQNHAIIDDEHDDGLHSRFLYQLAQQAGAPMILAQDSHYVHKRDRGLHDIYKELGSWSDDPDSAKFPGDGYHMVDTRWMRRHHEPDIFEAGMEGLAHLEEIANVTIPELDTFRLTVPDTTGTGAADEVLTKLVDLGIEAKLRAGQIKATKEAGVRRRAKEELEVIIPQRFAGYILFTASVTDFLKERDIRYNIRGSASGSLVCWLLGITQFPPIPWKLRFDRFLSTDHTKPPDIDIDVEHERRGEVVAWLREQYHVLNISTWGKYKVDDDDEDEDDGGSLIVKYKQWARKVGKNPNAKVPPRVMEMLRALAEHEPYKGYGVHAAGLIVTPDEESMGIVPLQYVASSKTMVSGYDMKSVEKLGLVKLDVLGLKTLTALRIMEDATGVRAEEVPLNDKPTLRRLAKGETTGCFQVGEWTARRGMKQLQPRNIHDVIAAMALFRPAAMKSDATEDYITRRHGRQPVPERHEIINRHTADTFGVLLYQEQALAVMQEIGLTVEEVERARKAIKASNDNVAEARVIMHELLAKIRTLGSEKGLSYSDLAWLELALEAYADYGFNRAHATSYGVLAYVTTWYREHHPVAFWGGMLHAYAGAKKKKVSMEQIFLKEAKKDGVRIFPPHVNSSGVSYEIDTARNGVRKGLISIHNVGKVASAELIKYAPYDSLTDLATKVAPKRVTGSKHLGVGHHPLACGGVVAALEDAGALRGLDHTNTIPEEK